MDEFGIAQQLIARLEKRRRRRTASVRAYLDAVLAACRALIQIEDVTSDSAAFLHTKLKAMYDQASASLGDKIEAGALALVMRAISGARVYYWALQFERENELRRKQPNRSPSAEAFYRMMLDEVGDAWGFVSARQVRERCLSDVTELEMLRLSIGSA